MSRSEALQQVKSSYLNRKTLFDYVKENMSQANRTNFFQRIIYIGKNAEANEKVFTNQFRETVVDFISESKNFTIGDHISGLILQYPNHIIHMIEGSEDLVTLLCRTLAINERKLFIKSKIVLFYNNMNQPFFYKTIWRRVGQPHTIERANLRYLKDAQIYAESFVKKLYDVCTMVREDLGAGKDDGNKKLLSSNYNKTIPEEALIESLLESNLLCTISNYFEGVDPVRNFVSSDDKSWPVPCGFTPPLSEIQSLFEDKK